MATPAIPAAQYLRMSTEHQQYSFDNQSAVIRTYAELNGYELVQTYSDAARSGLTLRERPGLQRLLNDVVVGRVPFRSILVYDVSRWGRFQDADEAAHYEFLCKKAGVTVHYCAEQFANDGTMPSLLMKALKRTMAAEYSRELGVKSYEGQKRLAQMGYKMGGVPGYGLRRMLISPSGEQKQQLEHGEHKNISTDRVVSVHGPKEEVEVVREIFRLALAGMRPASITRELNRSGVTYRGREWKLGTVCKLLKNPRYIGCNVWGQTSLKLHSPRKLIPREQWVTKEEAFPAIVEKDVFEKVQSILNDRTPKLTNDELLRRLKRLLARKGKLTHDIIDAARDVPSWTAYYYRFGGVARAYGLIGYSVNPNYVRRNVVRLDRQALRDRVVTRIAALFPNTLTAHYPGAHWRPFLRTKQGVKLSVILCPSHQTPLGHIRWMLPVDAHRGNPTLICLLNGRNDRVRRLYMFERIDIVGQKRLRLSDPWFATGRRLRNISEVQPTLEAVVNEFSAP